MPNRLPYCVAFFLWLAIATILRADQDPLGWAVLVNHEDRSIRLLISPERGEPRSVDIAPNEAIWLTDSLRYKVSADGNRESFTIEATPPDQIPEVIDREKNRMSVAFQRSRPDLFPLTMWQARYHHIVKDSNRLRIASGFSPTLVNRISEDYRKRLNDAGIDGKQLPVATSYNGELTSDDAPLSRAYNAFAAELISDLLERHLHATPRSWRRVIFTTPHGTALRESEDTVETAKIAALVRTHGPASPEILSGCAEVIAACLSIKREHLEVNEDTGPQPCAAAARLSKRYLGPDGKPAMAAIRDAILNELGKLGVRVRVPADEASRTFELATDWRYDGLRVPPAFKGAAVRSRVRITCAVRGGDTGKPLIQPAADIECLADIETKAAGSDRREFRRLASIGGFQYVSRRVTGSDQSSPNELTVEEEMSRIEQRIAGLLREEYGSEWPVEEIAPAPEPASSPTRVEAPKQRRARELGVTFHVCEDGIHLDSVLAKSPATRCIDRDSNSRMTLEANDHILDVDGIRISGEKEFRRAISESSGRLILRIRDHRDSNIRFFIVDCDK